MKLDFFTFKKRIGQHLTDYLRLKGYTKTSLSKIADISRPTLNQILDGSSPNPNIYNQQLAKITDALDLPSDYFIAVSGNKAEKWQLASIQYSDRKANEERSEWSQELLEDLDELLTVAAFYIRE
jgi:transcriptional regulator with XRE-family HTH domain